MSSSGHFNLRALGGLGEIGMNCLVMEVEGRLLVIDCGVMFSSDSLGVDFIHPGFEYLIRRQGDVEGIVLTHAHEDHVSGVPFLIQHLDAPVFAGSYAIGLLNKKASETGTPLKPMTRELSLNSPFELGPFKVTAFPMPHSIIQNTGLVVETSEFRMLHTGDYKLDVMGSDGGQGALDTLRKAAEGGVDLMLSDSTGAEEYEDVGNEALVAETLNKLFSESTGRVFVATFSSNLERVKSVMKLAHTFGRKVALCGLSVQNHVDIAHSTCGMALPPCDIISLDEAAVTPRNRLAVVVSGTQGEYRSALNRLAIDTHHRLRVDPGDTVILSSRIIPGNELPISRMIDQLILRGAKVYHRHNRRDVHVSGHGSRREIRSAIEAVSPRCFVPVHGTVHHLHACAELARDAGVKHVQIAVNGQSVRCDSEGITVRQGEESVRNVYIDSGGHLPESVIRDRRILGINGVLFVSVPLNTSGEINGVVDIVMRGVISDDASGWLTDLILKRVDHILEKLSAEDRADTSFCHDKIRSGLRRFLSKQISREPYVLVSIRPE